MHEIVSIDKWLRIVAAELESKGFPPGYGPQLRHAAEVLENVDAQIFSLDAANIQMTEQLTAKEREFESLRRDMAILWARYKRAVEIISQHDKNTAVTLAEYKPRFHEIL